MQRPFRFGFVVAGASIREPAGLREHVRAAESLGYSVALLPDLLRNQLAPVPAMAFVAEATTTLRVGSFVLVNDYRNPGVLARELATIDMLSGGRLEIGLGA